MNSFEKIPNEMGEFISELMNADVDLSLMTNKDLHNVIKNKISSEIEITTARKILNDRRKNKIVIWKSISPTKLEWHKNHSHHRDGDLPAIIEYYESGEVKAIIWCKNGEYHRDGKFPAVIRCYRNGRAGYKARYKNGHVEMERYYMEDGSLDTDLCNN